MFKGEKKEQVESRLKPHITFNLTVFMHETVSDNIVLFHMKA